MAQIGKLEPQVDITSPEKLFGFFWNHLDRLVQLFPENVKSLKILQGDKDRASSVLHVKYDLGSPMTAKVKIDIVGERNKSIT
ncbi:Major latex protein [Quillaja saponaria]|uniref:Major latex protein n=1 Tax=Quillaja saponaria TaxID=32244 RepID=A0AAD7PM12_QUISA|nr:Major latex protein [Quillaja saponaria]